MNSQMEGGAAMSSVHAEGKRGPGVVRAAVKISLGCVLLGERSIIYVIT